MFHCRLVSARTVGDALARVHLTLIIRDDKRQSHRADSHCRDAPMIERDQAAVHRVLAYSRTRFGREEGLGGVHARPPLRDLYARAMQFGRERARASSNRRTALRTQAPI